MLHQGAFDCGSFAHPAPKCTASWFVDGAMLFEAAAVAISNAQREIMITDWMLSPEVNTTCLPIVTVYAAEL